jgi:hypothetical protein
LLSVANLTVWGSGPQSSAIIACRLMVGQWTLTPLIFVRVEACKPSYKKYLHKLVHMCTIGHTLHIHIGRRLGELLRSLTVKRKSLEFDIAGSNPAKPARVAFGPFLSCPYPRQVNCSSQVDGDCKSYFGNNSIS